MWPDPASNKVLSPWHMATSFPKLMVGRGVTVIATSSVATQLPSVAVTVKVVLVVGVTLMLAVVSPVFQA